MTSTMLSERGLRRKMIQETSSKTIQEKNGNNGRKSSYSSRYSKANGNGNGNGNNGNSNNGGKSLVAQSCEQNNNIKRPKLSCNSKEEMLATYQPWVIQTYGDLAKTKTITIKKYARILRTLRGEETVSADNSKFRFWVKAKGFHVGKPHGYDAKPADAIVGRYSVCDTDEGIVALDDKLPGSAKDPPLYVPNAPSKNSISEAVYRKVAVVENFFDIIYNVHVELEGRPGKHAGQKRTYRTITETYAFLPREAVTRFLLGCTDCQRHPRSPSPSSVLPTPSPSPTLPLAPTTAPLATLTQSNVTITTSNCALTPSSSSSSTSSSLIQTKTNNSQNSINEPTKKLSGDEDDNSSQEKKHSNNKNNNNNNNNNNSNNNNHVPPSSIPPRQEFGLGPSQNQLNTPHSPIPISCKTTNLNSLPSYPNQFLASSPPSHYVDYTKSSKCNGTTFAVSNVTFDSPSPTLDLSQRNQDIVQSQGNIDVPLAASTPEPKRSSNPLDVCNLTAKDPPKSPKKLHPDNLSEKAGVAVSTPTTPKLWSPVQGLNSNESHGKRSFVPAEIDFSMPITTTYLRYMRSLGCTEDEAFKFEQRDENLATPEPAELNEEDHIVVGGSATLKDTDKLKLMLLAWNYHNQAQGPRNGSSDVPDLPSLPGGEDMAGLWAQYHSALGLAKGKSTPPTTRDQSSPVNAETGSAHDETSSSGNKEDEDDDDDESDDKIDTQTHDPERLKAFNMFVRLFVDENLDRMVPISKQPKEKIQAIIDSCTRQFPEFAERARKRIRTYLKSCRRNKRARDPNSGWDATRPTPAHLTSVQAEQILATACENESHNAKRMRLGLEPVSQPMPILPGTTTIDTSAPTTRSLDLPGGGTPVKLEIDSGSGVFPSSTTPSSTPNSISKGLSLTPDIKPTSLSSLSCGGGIPVNGIGLSSTPGTAPTAMYRPNFSQAFQRTGPYPLFPGQPFSGTGTPLLANGPTDLSMKQKPLLNHKLSVTEMSAVRQLITGYRESAAFLLRSAEELEQLLLQQQ